MSIHKKRPSVEHRRSKMGWGSNTSGVSSHIAQRTFSASLAVDAEAEFGYMRCPCCRVPMIKSRRANARNHVTSETPTVAHHIAVAYGGNPRVWVYACHRCNNQQGGLDFRQWSATLRAQGDDRRAEHAERLANWIEAWCARNGVMLRTGRSQ